MPLRSPMSPTDFLNRVGNLGGIAKNSRFTVSIVPPITLAATIQAEAISFLCRQAEIPAIALNTTEDRVYGIEVLKPYGVTYEPITLSFYNTNDFSPRKFWEDWLDHIQPMKSRNMSYYDNIIGDIKIFHYSEDALEPSPGYENYHAHLKEAWPVSIQESELAWGEDEPDGAAFDVQIQYKYWSRGLVNEGGGTRGNAAAAGGEQTETIGSF